MVNVTLPDGNIKSFEYAPTGLDVAKSISDGFARECVAMQLNGDLVDLAKIIDHDVKIRLIRAKDPEALDILRHSAAHVMAQAVLRIFKDAKLTIGPAVEEGFYYDIDMQPISKEEFYKDEPYKLEMISDLDEGTISFYEQGEFTDLCRGPHVPHTGYVKNLKLTKISGAYWRADPSKPQLQRIYGTAFFSKKELKDHLTFLEEAKKRNHRKIGQALDLFSFHEAAPGMPFFHPRGMEIWNALLEYWRVEHREAGYVETKTPIMLNRDLWERSGHWDNYRENMYTSAIDDIEYAIKPMNCPGGVLIYGHKPHSYRDLPLRAAEIGLVHRHELSGVLNGLFRVRAFHQDDAHLYMTPDQIHQEILGILKLSDRMYSAFGLGFDLELSTRPEKSIGTEAQWETATNGLESALKSYGKNRRWCVLRTQN
jgi:threonyl-tRNA synthetase